MDIRVFTPEKLQKGKLKITEHKTDIQNPWNVKESESWNIELAKINLHEDPDEIVLLSEIQPNFQHNLDVLVCCLIIGGILSICITFKQYDIRIFANISK